MNTDLHNTSSQLELPLPDGTKLACRIRFSDRARTLRLRILPPDGEVELVVPPYSDVLSAKRFALSRLDWILKSREPFLRGDSAGAWKHVLLPRSLPLRYLGGDLTVEYVFRPCAWTAAKCEPEARRITVTGNVLDPVRVKEALRDMLKRCTVDCLIPHFQGLAEKFDFTPGNCTIRIQKGRWGSCSSRGGAISLNAMLLLLPDDIVEYILIHELCHLRRMDHSERFWKEVEKYCPDFQERRKKLRILEKELPGYFL